MTALAISMVTADQPPGESSPPCCRAPQVFHRISEVRRRQGISLRSVARQMGIELREARRQEAASTDLTLSQLHRWQQVLGVPLEELLVESDAPLSRPVMERARLLRIMKTAAAIRERAQSASIRRMAEMFVEQLVEVMPELEQVSPWHAVGQRRSLDELGRTAEQSIPDDFLHNPRFE